MTLESLSNNQHFYLMTDFNWMGTFLLKFRDTYCIWNWTLFRHTSPTVPGLNLEISTSKFYFIKEFSHDS